jgi:hypothetical protein
MLLLKLLDLEPLVVGKSHVGLFELAVKIVLLLRLFVVYRLRVILNYELGGLLGVATVGVLHQILVIVREDSLAYFEVFADDWPRGQLRAFILTVGAF